MATEEHRANSALLIEDDGVFRERLAKSLERRGWVVHQAGDSDEGLAAARQLDLTMAIVDLRLPGSSGLDLLAELRELAPAAFILVLTGYGSIATALHATRTGADHYLGKPADAEQILAAFTSFRNEEASAPSPDEGPVPSLARVEWEHIQRVLADCGGNISQAAKLLGLHRRSLQRKLSKYPPAI
jgi:two-component system response regulator RegA